MIASEQLYLFQCAFPLFQRAPAPITQEFQQAAFMARLPAGRIVFGEGDQASALALVLSGTVRVYKTGKNGREITLYRFCAGESCILTANAILASQPFPACAIVEESIEAVMIPSESFRDWISRHALWREFFFNLLSVRLTSVLTLVDDLVFRRMDERIASLLVRRASTHNPVRVTHQEIAIELGSSREVISRILLGFISAGLIRSRRGEVEILDFASLNALADG